MLEEKLSDLILVVENQLKLVKIKIKKSKIELKELEKQFKNNEYIDIDKVKGARTRLKEEISKLDIRVYKLNKILYRLKVCEKMLNNED